MWLEDAVDVDFVYARGAFADCSLRLKSREALLNGELADFESTDIFTERGRGGTLIESQARPLMALEMFLLGRNETEGLQSLIEILHRPFRRIMIPLVLYGALLRRWKWQ